MNKREWLESQVGRSVLIGLDDSGYDFYYKAMHDNGMDFSDADRYAWLNTLFGYDIGAEHALGIINWYYERDIDVMELGAYCKRQLIEDVQYDLGYHLDFQYFVDEEPDYITFDWR